MGRAEYRQLRQTAARQTVSPTKAGGGAAQQTIDFDALLVNSPDVIAWLSCTDTPIDYPVVQAGDNDYYLRRLPTGEWNIGGSIFMDYRAPADFSGKLHVIYGHNMKNGSMFGTLEKYSEQAWYEAHPSFTLETPGHSFLLQPVYGFVIEADEWTRRGFSDEDNRKALAAYAEQHTAFVSAASLDLGGPWAALVTCAAFPDTDRFVLLCQMSKSTEIA